MKMSKKLIVVALATAITVPAYAWVPIVDDIKKVVEDVKKGAAALTCGAAAGVVTANPVIIAGAAGTCANEVK